MQSNHRLKIFCDIFERPLPALPKMPKLSAPPWHGPSQCLGAFVGFFTFMSFAVFFFEFALAGTGFVLLLKLAPCLAAPGLVYAGYQSLHRGAHRSSSFCCAFLTTASMLVAFTALRFGAVTAAPVAIEGPSFQHIGGLGLDDFGFLQGEGISPMVQPDGLSCLEHIRVERLKTGIFPCGDACTCLLRDDWMSNSTHVATLSWNLMGHLPERRVRDEWGNEWTSFAETTSNSVHVPMWIFPTAALLHIFPSILALALGPIQLNVRVRQASFLRHRIIGWIYVLGVLCGAVGAWYLTMVSTQPFWGSFSFVLLAAAWMSTLLVAVFHILHRHTGSEEEKAARVLLHKEWMVRNYALTFAATSLRWEMAILQEMLGKDVGYALVSWTCWVPNAMIVEYYIRRVRTRAAPTSDVQMSSNQVAGTFPA
jgi:hypothetical protein